MLAPDTWARVVRIDNRHPRGAWRGQAYPRTMYALVFELSGILWLYCDVDGTQSLSLTRGTAARDEADPGPLFRAIDPGVASWEWADSQAAPAVRAGETPPRACFLESLRALNRRVAAGGEADSPQLLLYYVDSPMGRLGHTVLLFRSAGSLSVINSMYSDKAVRLPAYLGSDMLSIAEYVKGGTVSGFRTLAIAGTRKAPPGGWATIPSRPVPEG